MSLYVIEGLDGSGKGTQFNLLFDYLTQKGEKCVKIDFPDYESQSSALVKMYLAGEFGSDPKNVNAYAVSTFYAVDRYSSYQKTWKNDYLNSKTIIANRYVSSNIVFQMTKLDKQEWDDFIDWLNDLEHNKFGLPKPDKVIYLDMPIEVSQKLLNYRYKGDENKKDIHEKNISFLNECRECALYAAKKLGWAIINCSDGENAKSIEKINKVIIEEIERNV